MDVDAAPGGCWIASLSMDTAGFAPYRIDNCTSYTLHCRQESCNVRADVLRPYCRFVHTMQGMHPCIFRVAHNHAWIIAVAPATQRGG